MIKRSLSLVLALILVVSCAAVMFGCNNNDTNNQAPTIDYKTAQNLENGVILQCFSWDFNTIKNSIPEIAAAGYSAIQTSPVNECLEGENGGMQLYGNGKWYYHYQPTDFKIGNYQLGTRDEFKAMCDTAHKYGIRVIVDVIANHTTPTTEAVSQDLLNAVGGIEKLYHKNTNKDIVDWGNRLHCTTYKMGGLPDINTENTAFQEYFFKFINDTIDCGADGFRYDTAKHIGLPDDEKEDDGYTNNFWEKAVKDVKNADKLFIYGEVLQGNNDRIADYIEEIGRTTSSSYGQKLRSSITNSMFNADDLVDFSIGSAKPNVVTWVESHDNYINDGSYSELNDEQVALAWAVIAARKQGTPLFFNRPYGSSAENSWGTMNRIGAKGNYSYKSDSVVAVNRFRTAMQGEEEILVNPNDDFSSIMIERGKKGAVIVTLEQELQTGFETNLADGTYTDRVDTKTVYTVKNGKLTGDKIKANTIVVLYNEGYINYAKPASVSINDDINLNYEGESVEVVLHTDDAESASYSIDDGEEKSYKNGDKITITKGDSNITTLTLKAKNSLGLESYMKYYFTKKVEYKITGDDSVYFIVPDNWGKKITLTITDDLNKAAKEETVTMNESASSYYYTFDKSWEKPMGVFSDGTNKYPADGTKIELAGEEVYRTTD